MNEPLPNAPAMRGKVLAGCELVGLLGRGGMAEVFLARRPGAAGTSKAVVVKRILPRHGTSRQFRRMFVEEAELATRLNHPNVTQVYELASTDEGHVLVMEYVEGCDLSRLLAGARSKGERIDPFLAAWIVAEAAKGLHYAHERRDEAGRPLQIVHRDVSPHNILLSFDGAVKIADFGIASARTLSEPEGSLRGKYGYMSPEQARAEPVDARSDIYALGVILWEALVGRSLHEGLSGDALLEVVRSGHAPRPSEIAAEVPEELEAVVMHALAPRREDRIPTARHLATSLSRVLLNRQLLVDASQLEVCIRNFVGERDGRVAELQVHYTAEEQKTQAAGPRARASAPAPSYDEDDVDEDLGTGQTGTKQGQQEAIREVRHVVLLSLRIEGGPSGNLPSDRRALPQVRALISDLAFKHQVELVWSGDLAATALGGTGSNPTGAVAQVLRLALDVHDTLADLETIGAPFQAAISVVRGLASGRRDSRGHLVDAVLREPAEALSHALGLQVPAGTTWATGGVYRLVRREFLWREAPEFEPSEWDMLHAIPATVRVFEVAGRAAREDRLALEPGAELVGREAERAELNAAFHSATSTRPGRLSSRAVMGEVGIGKSELVAAFVQDVPRETRVYRVTFAPVHTTMPSYGLGELVRALLGLSGREDLKEASERATQALAAAASEAPLGTAAVLAELATSQRFDRDEDDALARRRTQLAAIRTLLHCTASQAPTVVILDELQWADKPSLEIMADVARGTDALPLLLLLVSRTDDRVSLALHDILHIEVASLSAEELVRLVELRLGVRDGVLSACSDLIARVAGNPFFLLEMVDALLERGVLEIRTSGDQQVLVRVDDDAPGDELPSTLEQLVRDRLRELPASEKAIIRWLAVAAGPLTLPALEVLGPDDAEDATTRLCARGLCDRAGDEVDVRHAITRDVAYLDLDAHERTRLHRELGEYLATTASATGLSAAIVARHLMRGEVGARAAEYYLEAAATARTSYQNILALRYYHRALGLLPRGDRRSVAVHAAMENLCRFLGRRRDRLNHLRELRTLARSAEAPTLVALALVRTARLRLDDGHLANGLTTASQAAEVARAAKTPSLEVEAELLMSEFQRELGEVQEALVSCDRALLACAADVSPRMRAEVLRSRGVLLRRVGRVHDAVAAYREAIQVFRSVGAQRLEARAKNALAFAMFVEGNYEESIALARESLSLDLSIGARLHIAKTLTNIGHAYGRIGDFSRAEAYLARAVEVHERYADQDGRADTLIVRAKLLLEVGRLDEAIALVGDAGALAAATENAYDKTYELIARAIWARAVGKHAEAAEHASTARRLSEAQTLVSFGVYAAALEAASRASLGDAHAADYLAKMAIGIVRMLQGSEYDLEARALCSWALATAGSSDASTCRREAGELVERVRASLVQPGHREAFEKRRIVRYALGDDSVTP